MIQVFKTPVFARRMFPRRIWGFSSSDTVYLTFDDGPTPEMTRWILETLEATQVKATFFCVGANAEKHPELMAEIVEKGHAIGNHTMYHEKGTSVQQDEYLESIKKAANHISSNLFRPPYGRMPKAYEKRILKDYQIVMWSWLSYDFDNSVSVERILEKAEEQIQPGDILVLHDNKKVEDRVKYLLPKLIDLLKNKNLKFDVISF